MRSRPLVPLVALAAVALAGCGSPGTYTLDKTRACLEEQESVKVRDKVDFVASTAPGGAINVKFRTNEVTISFGENREDARRLAEGYRRVAGKNIGIEDVLRPSRNVVMLWAAHPTEEHLQTIQRCLE